MIHSAQKTSLLIALIALLVDQFSKWFVVFHLDLRTIGLIDVFPPFLRFAMGWNTGINFGLFGGNGVASLLLFTGLAIGICIWLFLWAKRQAHWLAQAGIGLIMGGAIGNALDRILYGAVADFLNMSCCGITNPYSFNVADIFIFGGVGLLIVFSDRDADQSSKK